MASKKYKGLDGISRTEDEIEREIDRGHKDPSALFGAFATVGQPQKGPVRKVNIDLTAAIIKELDAVADLLNISRQAVIKTYIKSGLDAHLAARKKHRA